MVSGQFAAERPDLYPFEVTVRGKATRKLLYVYYAATRDEARAGAASWRVCGAYSAKVSER